MHHGVNEEAAQEQDLAEHSLIWSRGIGSVYVLVAHV